MRFGVCGVSVLALSLLVTGPALAQEPSAALAVERPVSEPPAPPTLAQQAASVAADVGRVARAHSDDIAALRAFYAANPETSLWIEGGALSGRARAAMEKIGKADDWGLTASSFTLPTAPEAGQQAQLAAAEATLSLAILTYARHARGGRMDPTLLTEAIDRSPNLLPPGDVMAGIAAAEAPEAYLRGLHPRHPQFERLRQLYLALKAGTYQAEPAPQPVAEEAQEPTRKSRNRKKKKVAKPAAPPPLTADKVLANMEQWRWMPDDLGRLHVAVNIPEFQMRVMKEGREIHTERVIVGTVANQTPIFSKDMQTVVFQPGWGVPPSIKVKELLPGLLAGRDPVAARGYRMSFRGRMVTASQIDWRRTDIRRVSIVQPPGPSNALGQVKFMFPNKHDVYMHDTPSKSLFNSETRAYSAGCVRVRNPMRFAEVLFHETAGLSPQRVASMARSRPENEIKVDGRVAVHMTYFTVLVDDAGKPRVLRDIYGHVPRIIGGLEGRIEQVARPRKDLTAIRSAIVSQASSRRVASYAGERGVRQERNGRSRAVRVNRSSGGLFGWFD
jgi:murein L,D-transpeptidase YcbB/YkuD